MNENTPVTFEYVNNSLTTFAQSKLISKVASHFKIPMKKLRNQLDLDKLKDSQVVLFKDDPGQMGYIVDKGFYVTSFPEGKAHLTMAEQLSPKQFEASKLSTELALAQASIPEIKTGQVLFCAYTPPLIYVLVDMKDTMYALDDSEVGKVEGVGGIYIHFPPLVSHSLLMDMGSYLDTYYPHPPSLN